MLRRLIQAFVVSLVFGLVGLALVFWLNDVQFKDLSAIWQLSWFSLLGAIGALAFSFIFSSLRLQHLCRRWSFRLKFRYAMRTHALGLFSAAVTPSGSGATPAVALSLQYQGLSSVQAWSTGIALFVADTIFMLWMLPLSIFFLRWHGLYPKTILANVVAVISFSITALIAYILIYRLDLLNLLFRTLLRGPLLRFRKEALRFSTSLEQSHQAFTGAPWRFHFMTQLWTLLSWLAFFQILTLMALGLDIKIPVIATTAYQVATSALALVVPTPGGSGFFEFATSFLLLNRNHDEMVPAILLSWRFLSFYIFFLIGPFLGGHILLKQLEKA